MRLNEKVMGSLCLTKGILRPVNLFRPWYGDCLLHLFRFTMTESRKLSRKMGEKIMHSGAEGSYDIN